MRLHQSIIAGVWLVGALAANASTYTAATVALADVQAAVNLSAPGDTVIIPAGTATWSGSLTVTNDIQIIGAGIGQTIVSNGVNLSLVGWTTVSNGFCRLSGIDWEYGPGDATNTYGATRLIVVSGTCHAFRLDNCMFNGIHEYNVWFNGWVYGVVDHCTFNSSNAIFQVEMDSYGGQQNGDGSWADADRWGTTNALYIESCTFNGPIGTQYGLDSVSGARIVIRNNNCTNFAIASHGTDSTPNARGMRYYEVYNNNMTLQTNGWTPWAWAVQVRSGTALVWSNSIHGGYQNVAGLSDYRSIPVSWPPWGSGNVTGVNPWDSNSATLFDSGTSTATNNSPVLVDSTKSWTVNQWVNTTNAFVLYDVSQGIGAVITANDATSLTIAGSFQGYTGNNGLGYMAITNGDSYQIRQVFSRLDQCGFGQGDLLTNRPPTNSVTGTVAWPHEMADPVYIWGNNFSFDFPSGSYPTALYGAPFDGLVVTNTPKPSYTALAFPHPLTLGTTNTLATVSGPLWLGLGLGIGQPIPAGSSGGGGGDITTGLISDWRFNGNLTDTTGGNNLNTTGVSYGTGQNGAASGAVALNGSQDTYDSAFPTTYLSGSFTASAWINVADLSAARFVLWTGGYQNNGWYLAILTDGTIQAVVSQSGVGEITTSAPGAVTTGTWFLVTLVYDGSHVTIYKNGVNATVSAPATSAPATTSSFVVGSAGGASYFSGTIDEVMLFGVAKTSTDVALIYSTNAR